MCKKIRIIGLLVAVTVSVGFIGCGKTEKNKEVVQKEITVSAAASLKESLDKIKDEYEKSNKAKVNINYGGSGALKKQIQEGADVDFVFFASKQDMKDLEEKDLMEKGQVKDLLSNSLVLVKSNLSKCDVKDLEGLKSGEYKIALGEIGTVPAGKYAKEALEKSGQWKNAESKTIFAKDVKAVAQYVEKGEVDMGIIYATDATGLKDSKVIFTIPEELHSNILYSAGVTAGSKNKEEAKEFFKYLQGADSKKIFEEFKFKVK